VMMGALVVSKNPIEDTRVKAVLKGAKYEGINFMPEVSTSQAQEYGDKSRDAIVVIDTGVKYSIIRNILRTGYRVVRLPWNATHDQVRSYNPKGVVISNGPGDPKVCTSTIKTASHLIKEDIPTLGICLGNQILALAGGADTYKLKFGHRGQNKPCVDKRSDQVYVTSQNHGYGVDPKTLSKAGFKVWFSNADDDTVEGIEHKSKPVIAVQFHPEASPGPYDCMFVFDRFKEIISSGKQRPEIPSKPRVSKDRSKRSMKKGGRKSAKG
ncbi:MAG TPA: carbamoyl phosphate synthase small subunit, partial [Nitrososphaera sp.]|nr:carbamoyl phosphate synthase small subunit [Nitrososphaera sp.]